VREHIIAHVLFTPPQRFQRRENNAKHIGRQKKTSESRNEQGMKPYGVGRKDQRWLAGDNKRGVPTSSAKGHV